MYAVVGFLKNKNFSPLEKLEQVEISPQYNNLIYLWKISLSFLLANKFLNVNKHNVARYTKSSILNIMACIAQNAIRINAFIFPTACSILTVNTFACRLLLNKIEENSKLENKNILLRIRANRLTDSNGALLPGCRSLFSLYALSKEYSIYTREITQNDFYQEIDGIVSSLSKKGSIKILIIEGHGTQKSILLHSDIDGRIGRGWESRKHLSNISKKLDKDCVIILNSCSTGKGYKNIAAYLSKVSNRTVFAPKGTTCGFPKISLEDNNYKVHYYDKSSFEATKFVPYRRSRDY
jgi:hypothetical protein